MLATEGIHHLVGFENNCPIGTGHLFNPILSNGHRSQQRDNGITYYDHKMPAEILNRIRSVKIYSYSHLSIIGFSFFDKDK